MIKKTATRHGSLFLTVDKFEESEFAYSFFKKNSS